MAPADGRGRAGRDDPRVDPVREAEAAAVKRRRRHEPLWALVWRTDLQDGELCVTWILEADLPIAVANGWYVLARDSQVLDLRWPGVAAS